MPCKMVGWQDGRRWKQNWQLHALCRPTPLRLKMQRLFASSAFQRWIHFWRERYEHKNDLLENAENVEIPLKRYISKAEIFAITGHMVIQQVSVVISETPKLYIRRLKIRQCFPIPSHDHYRIYRRTILWIAFFSVIAHAGFSGNLFSLRVLAANVAPCRRRNFSC